MYTGIVVCIKEGKVPIYTFSAKGRFSFDWMDVQWDVASFRWVQISVCVFALFCFVLFCSGSAVFSHIVNYHAKMLMEFTTPPTNSHIVINLMRGSFRNTTSKDRKQQT